MEIVVICAFSVVASVVALFIKQYRPEYSSVILTAASVIILTSLVKTIVPLIGEYLGIVSAAGLDRNVFSVILKALGISLITVFASDICSDAGQSSLAGRVEFAGKVAIVILAFPLIREVLSIVSEILQ